MHSGRALVCCPRVLQGLDLDDGDTVTFSEVKGMEGLNTQGGLLVSDCSKGKKNFVVVVPAPAATLGAYTSGGLVSEVRMPKQLAYRSLHDFLLSPGDLWEVDESKMAPAATSFAEEFLMVMGSPAANVRYGRAGLLHLGFRALDEFAKTHGGALPQPAVEAEAQAFLKLAEQLNAANDADNKVCSTWTWHTHVLHMAYACRLRRRQQGDAARRSLP